MTRYKGAIAKKLAKLDQDLDSSGDRILGFLDLYRTALNGGDTLCLCVALSMGRDTLTEETLRQIADFRGQTLAWLQEVFALAAQDGSICNVCDPSKEAAAALALAEGAQVSARSEQNMQRFDHATEMMRQRIRSGPSAAAL
jgi:TetR/AcrR family transcriptional repressor of nem operon